MNNKKISIVALVVVPILMMSIQISTAQFQTPSDTNVDNYNWTMSGEYTGLVIPEFNDNIDILNILAEYCNNNYANGATNDLEKCYTIMERVE